MLRTLFVRAVSAQVCLRSSAEDNIALIPIQAIVAIGIAALRELQANAYVAVDRTSPLETEAKLKKQIRACRNNYLDIRHFNSDKVSFKKIIYV